MSFGNSPADNREMILERLRAQVDRASRLAGHKSLLRDVLERLRPHHQEPDSDPQSNYGTSDDPGH